MNDVGTLDAYAVPTEPATLTLRRLLPGPIERVWAYLTESELRRQWFASGEMTLQAGAPVEFVWRNDDLTDPPGRRPEGFGAEHRMQCEIVAVEPPRRLTFTFGPHGEVSVVLEPRGGDVLLTLVHRRIPDRATMDKVAPGWHAHLDLLVARLSGRQPEPFWDAVGRLRGEYEHRLPAAQQAA